MAEFLTMHEAEDKFGTKGKTNAALTLGIIGTGLAALNNSGCNGGGGLLGGLLGGCNKCQDGPTAFQAWQKECEDNVALTSAIWSTRVTDLQEKFDLYTRLDNKITDLEKKEVATATALPLMFQLAKVNAERYSDDCCCKTQKDMLMLDANLQRQIDHKIDGELKYAYSNLCAPVPNISPLYCTPFTPVGSGTCYNRGCDCGSN